MFFSAIQYRGQNKRPLRTLKIEYCQEKCHQLTFLCEPVVLFRFVGPIKFKN